MKPAPILNADALFIDVLLSSDIPEIAPIPAPASPGKSDKNLLLCEARIGKALLCVKVILFPSGRFFHLDRRVKFI
jgi:hypothetical protein